MKFSLFTLVYTILEISVRGISRVSIGPSNGMPSQESSDDEDDLITVYGQNGMVLGCLLPTEGLAD